MINERLENLTEELLINNDIYKVPADILAIAKNNHIGVYTANLPIGNSGLIRIVNDEKTKQSKFEIVLSATESEYRQRFTLGHEIGHYFLHREILESEEIHIDQLNRMSDENEKEVDYFAGALLMNKYLVEKIYNDKTKNIHELAEIFEVSEAAMTVRLRILGLT